MFLYKKFLSRHSLFGFVLLFCFFFCFYLLYHTTNLIFITRQIFKNCLLNRIKLRKVKIILLVIFFRIHLCKTFLFKNYMSYAIGTPHSSFKIIMYSSLEIHFLYIFFSQLCSDNFIYANLS